MRFHVPIMLTALTLWRILVHPSFIYPEELSCSHENKSPVWSPILPEAIIFPLQFPTNCIHSNVVVRTWTNEECSGWTQVNTRGGGGRQTDRENTGVSTVPREQAGWSRIQFLAGIRNFSGLLNIQTGSGSHAASCSMGDGCSSPLFQVGVVWSQPPTSISCEG